MERNKWQIYAEMAGGRTAPDDGWTDALLVIKTRHPRPVHSLMTSHNFPRGDDREKRELTREEGAERQRRRQTDRETDRRTASK